MAVHLSYDAKSNRIAYTSQKSVFVRSLEDPRNCIQYTKHPYTATAVAFSPSGFYIASGDEAGNVKVWDAVEGQITKGEFHIISGRINAIAWDADSQRIIAVGDGKDKYGHCFTYDSGNSVGEISGHSGPINSVSIRPVRPYRAATVSDDGNLVFYQGPPFKFSHTCKDAHNNFVHDTAFSPDGAYLVSVGSDKSIALYDGKTGEYSGPLSQTDSSSDIGHVGTIYAVAWSPDSKQFATASADGSVRLWDVEQKSLVRKWTLPKCLENQQVGVVFAGKDRIVSLSYSGNLNIFDANEDTETPLKVIQGHQKSVSALCTAPDSKALISGSADGGIIKWSDNVDIVQTHKGPVVGLVDDGKDVWSTGWDDTLRSLSNSDKAIKLSAQPKTLSSSPSGHIVIACENEIIVFNNGEQVASKSVEGAICAAISDKYVAIGLKGSKVQLFDTELQSVHKEISLRSDVTCLSFSPDGKYLAAGDITGKIPLLDAETGDVITNRWAFHTSRITSIAWHKSGTHLVAASSDTNIIVYSVEKPMKNSKFLNAHKDGVNCLVWLSETQFASGGSDGAIKHWKWTNTSS